VTRRVRWRTAAASLVGRAARLVQLAVLAAAGLVVCRGFVSAQQPSTVIALRAAHLFDGRSDSAISDAVVVVQGGRISALGARTPIPAGAQVVDLGDATILAGFIDAHTHLTDESSDDWNADTVAGLRRSVPEATLRAAELARRTLMAGFTTVRDVGAADYIDVGLRNAIAGGVAVGPRMLVAVHALGARGGHCDNTGFPYQRFGTESGIADGIASGPDQFRDAVRFQIKYGADVIKVCATGGVLSLADDVGAAQITQAEMDAIVDEAHRLGRRTAAHAHGADGAKVAIRAGIDSIEHGSFLDDEAVRMMKERGTYLVPTLMAGEYAGGRKATRKYPPEIAAKALQALDGRSAAFKRAVGAGVRIAFGTDSGVSPHGRNAEEFALLVEHGLSPAAALRTSATAAALLGVDRITGTLEAGKEADIVAVPGDALRTITATEHVRFVMKGGKIVRNDGAGRN
jgi:imidazolonepropionase-like amidohydrolase